MFLVYFVATDQKVEHADYVSQDLLHSLTKEKQLCSTAAARKLKLNIMASRLNSFKELSRGTR